MANYSKSTSLFGGLTAMTPYNPAMGFLNLGNVSKPSNILQLDKATGSIDPFAIKAISSLKKMVKEEFEGTAEETK